MTGRRALAWPELVRRIVDAAVMNVKSLSRFVDAQIEDAKAEGVLFSLHLKATMMKVSDPIIFGHAVKTYFADVFAKHGDTFDRIACGAGSITAFRLDVGRRFTVDGRRDDLLVRMHVLRVVRARCARRTLPELRRRAGAPAAAPAAAASPKVTSIGSDHEDGDDHQHEDPLEAPQHGPSTLLA